MTKAPTSKRPPRNVIVQAIEDITPHMRRITLAGSDLASFPAGSEGNYFKLLFEQGSKIRTFTVSNQRSTQNEIDVDFVMHHSSDGKVEGLAAAWASSTKVRDSIQLAGPGNARFINTDADWFLLAADMTALPALSANLKRLPPQAKGHAVIEILHENDRQDLVAPAGIEIQWLVNPDSGSQQTPLVEAVRALPWHEGQVATWCACEFKSMQKLRLYLKNERQVARTHLYLSSYWKKGLSEGEHKVVKKQDQLEAGD